MKSSSADPLRIPVGPAPVTNVRLVDAEERARREALEEAFLAGLAQGRAEAAAAEAGALARACEGLEADRTRYSTELAHTAAELAVEVARVLLHTEVQAGRHDIERLVRETLESSAAGRSRCVVHLNPADVAALEGVPFRSGTTLEADTGVARGDVHVETTMGLMVRELDEVLAALLTRLRESLS